jgi:hypothetical protein
MVVRLSLGENRHEDRSNVTRSKPRRLCCGLCARADGSGTSAAASARTTADPSPGAGTGSPGALYRAGAAVAIGQEIPQMVPLHAGPASPGMAFAGAHDAVVNGPGSGPDGSGRRRGSGADGASRRSPGSGARAAQRPAARSAAERSLTRIVPQRAQLRLRPSPAQAR